MNQRTLATGIFHMFKRARSFLVLAGLAYFMQPFEDAVIYAQIPASVSSESKQVTWLSFSGCPVLLERSFEVPALESGVLEKVQVELNSKVTAGQSIAMLDEELALLEVKLAKVQYDEAVDLAADDGQLKLARNALKKEQIEFDSLSAIQKSVAASELRAQDLKVKFAELNVQKAERELKRLAIAVEAKAAAMQVANLRLNRRRITATSNGIVTAVHLQTGQWVEAGKPICTIADVEHLLVDCLIPIEKVDLKRIVGLEVRVSAEHTASDVKETPIRLAGKITSYDPQVSSQGMVRIHAKIQNARQGEHWLLLPGMEVRLEVAVPTGSPALISRQNANPTR